MWHLTCRNGHKPALFVYDYLEGIQPGLTFKVIGGVLTSAAVSYLAARGLRYYRNRVIVRERGECARLAIRLLSDHLTAVQESEGPVDEEKEAMIIGLPLTELQQKLWKGELTALQVLRAYQRKALEVTNRLNCVTEPIFEAEAIAVELDLLKPNQRKPLHGIPVSVKECVSIEGYDCNGGFAYFANKPATEDADLVKLLKSLGAVPFMRTNFPQGLMSYACSNPIYGETLNPHNPKRGPGGSTGGEGALIGGEGSILGIGSDIGGSIRIPCQMCGIYGLKPTVDRMVNRGIIALGTGQNLIRCTLGMMTRDMDGLIKVMQELFTPRMHHLDPVVPPIYFRDEVFEKKGPLRIGFYTSLPDLGSVHPACVRAVLQAKEVLETQYGYKLVEFQPGRAFQMMCDLYIQACFGDDGEDCNHYMKHEVLDQCVAFSYYIGGLPHRLRYLIAKLIELTMDRRVGKMGQSVATPPRKIIDWWYLEDRVEAYKHEMLKAWQEAQLDALICPGLPYPAVSHGNEDYGLGGITYMTLYNVLNYPAGMLPVTKVTSQDIASLKDPAAYPVVGAMEKFIIQDSEGSEGLPIGVQVVGLPYREEMVLRVMKDIDRHAGYVH